jgi:hypothetical protein
VICDLICDPPFFLPLFPPAAGLGGATDTSVADLAALCIDSLAPHACRYGFRMPLIEAISVIIMASQKSAPVAVTVISYITGARGSAQSWESGVHYAETSRALDSVRPSLAAS